MGKFILGYFIVAIVSNMLVSAVVLRLLFIDCKRAGLSYNQVYDRYFTHGEKVIPVIPPDFPLLLAIPIAFITIQILFPFNIRCLIVNYKNARSELF